jgi:hypothetical protein
VSFDKQKSPADENSGASEGGNRGVAVPIDCAQVDVAGGAAGRTARPQEPIAGRDGGADRRGEQHRHPLGLALVPNRNQVVGVLKDLFFGRAARNGFLFGGLPTPVLHFALVDPMAGSSSNKRGCQCRFAPESCRDSD